MAVTDQRLRKSQRLVHSRSFEDAYRDGRKFVGRHMILWVRAGSTPVSRLGVVTSRKVGNAVARNTTRRRLREIWRGQRARLTGVHDVVVVARSTAATSSWPDLCKDFEDLIRKAGLCA